MKLAILVTRSKEVVEWWRPLERALLEEDNEVRIFFDVEGHDDVTYCAWPDFDWQPIHDFNPRLVLTWNGYHQWCAEAWKTIPWMKATAEGAWFWRDRYTYLNKVPAQHEHFSEYLSFDCVVPEVPFEAYEKLDEIKSLYPAQSSDYAGCIIVPMQCEGDTAITEFSKVFKTNRSLIRFLRTRFPKEKIIAFRHPLDLDRGKIPEADGLVEDRRIMRFVAAAKAVVGINSTVLVESFLFTNKVVNLGYIPGFKPIPIKNLKSSSFYSRRGSSTWWVLAHLLCQQWDRTNPPRWIVDKIQDHQGKNSVNFERSFRTDEIDFSEIR